MQVSPSSDVREVPGKDNWKFFHVVQLVVVSRNSNINKFECNCIVAVRVDGEGSCISMLSLTESCIKCQ